MKRSLLDDFIKIYNSINVTVNIVVVMNVQINIFVKLLEISLIQWEIIIINQQEIK